MSTQINLLSDNALDAVSGGLRNFPIEPVPQPSAPNSPPLGHGPVILSPPTHGPFSAPPGILER